jgi:hypothetical protein
MVPGPPDGPTATFFSEEYPADAGRAAGRHGWGGINGVRALSQVNAGMEAGSGSGVAPERAGLELSRNDLLEFVNRLRVVFAPDCKVSAVTRFVRTGNELDFGRRTL